jgi:hypothetical protein
VIGEESKKKTATPIPRRGSALKCNGFCVQKVSVNKIVKKKKENLIGNNVDPLKLIWIWIVDPLK